MTGTSKGGLAALVVAVAAVGGYWYFSPYLAVKSMRAAAQSKDADTFNDHVDYPKLRESIKGQITAMMAEKLGSGTQNGAESLGAAIGLALLNPMVDAVVRPELVMRSMQEGKFEPKFGGNKSESPGQVVNEVQWDVQRKGFDKVIAHNKEASAADGGPGFVFERSGFATWKLTEVRLPALK